MNENFKAWMLRLRDPESKQAKGSLGFVEDYTQPISQAGMCCLGHAAFVAGRLSPHELQRYKLQLPNGDTALLDLETAEWLGIAGHPMLFEKSNYPKPLGFNIAIPEELRPDGHQPKSYVTELNDQSDLTLAQIADLLEKIFDPNAPWSQAA